MQSLVQSSISEPFTAAFLVVFVLIGLVVATRWVYELVTFLHRHLFRTTHNMFNRYGGPNAWAVVTGGSDGIGLEICD